MGGFDETMVDGCEDWEFWIRVVEAGFQGTIVPEFLFRYRRRADSMSRSMHAVPGMPALYRQLVDRHPDVFARHMVALLEYRDAEIASMSTSLWQLEHTWVADLEGRQQWQRDNHRADAARRATGSAGKPTGGGAGGRARVARSVQPRARVAGGLAGILELAHHTTAAHLARMDAAMSSLGAIVVAGTAPRTAGASTASYGRHACSTASLSSWGQTSTIGLVIGCEPSQARAGGRWSRNRASHWAQC